MNTSYTLDNIGGSFTAVLFLLARLYSRSDCCEDADSLPKTCTTDGLRIFYAPRNDASSDMPESTTRYRLMRENLMTISIVV